MKSVLIVENHPLTSNSYVNVIKSFSNELFVNINVVKDCKSAEEFLQQTNVSGTGKIDVVVIGLCVPYSSQDSTLHGESLCEKIREKFPKIKIVISTRIDCPYRIVSVLKKIDPDAILLKKDLTEREFEEAILNLLTNYPYYSKTVMKMLRKEISNGFMLDNIDRQLLYELSIGTRMKVLPTILPMTLRGIEKRKQQLKDIFNVKVSDDRGLVLKAKEVGLV